MKKWQVRTLFVALVVLMVQVDVSPALSKDLDVVAQVGSISISKYELGREFQRLLPMSGSYHGGVSKEKIAEVREKALDVCIERALKVMYALENEIAADPVAVKKLYDQVRGKFENQEAFEAALGGESPEAFRSSLFRQSLASAAEKAVIDDEVKISDAEMRKFYDENTDRFVTPIQYKASHILIKVDPAATAEERAERKKFAAEILAKAKNGEDFYNLAYYNSDDRTKFVGGDLGFFGSGQTVREFDAAVKSMKVGEISDLVETIYGYHIIKLTDIKPKGQMSYEDVQVTLLPQMKKAHRDKAYKDWIKQLREKYEVKILKSEE